MKFSTSSALLLSFLLLTSMMVEPVQSTETRIRENKDKNKQYDLPVRRTLKGKGNGGNGGGPKGKGNSGNGGGPKGKGGTCSHSNADKCVAKPAANDPDLQIACQNSDSSDITFPGACVGQEVNNTLNVCQNMDVVTVAKYACFENRACTGATYTDICESSCQGDLSCFKANSGGNATHILTIDPGSCRGEQACYKVQNVERIGSGSCIFDKACKEMSGDPADRTTVGENSCVGDNSCKGFLGKSIGDNACVGNGICKGCAAGIVVEHNECNIRIVGSDCPCP